MGFSRHEYWSGLPCHPQGSSPQSFSLLHWQGGSLQLTPPGKPNIGVHMSFSIMVFSGYMPSSGIVGSYDSFRSFSGGARVGESACQRRRHKRHRFDPWVGKIPCWKKWQPTPVFVPGESHGQRILAHCSPWGHKESDLTAHTHTLYTVCSYCLFCI